MDKLEIIFHKREKFMKLINKKFEGLYPEWPIDIKSKDSQKLLRQTALNGVEEMFEALGHLKNWKSHRETEVSDINKEEFLEEIVDAFNYFINILILCGFDCNDFFKSFERKDEIIKERLESNY